MVYKKQKKIDDKPENIVIFPEIMTNLISTIDKAKSEYSGYQLITIFIGKEKTFFRYFQ